MAEKLTSDWTRQTLTERLQFCKSMLYLHGMLTEAENRKVHSRLMKRVGALNLKAKKK